MSNVPYETFEASLKLDAAYRRNAGAIYFKDLKTGKKFKTTLIKFFDILKVFNCINGVIVGRFRLSAGNLVAMPEE